MSNSTRWIVAVSFILIASGFLLPYWPLSCAGVLLCALAGRWPFAIGMGLLLDIAYGAPVGRLHFLYFPFTEMAVAASLMRILLGRAWRRGPPQTVE